ncbi:molybdenum cofactor guanylyltransferase MobA [Glaciimonas immobilis]|nr:molybdenum cofactor guanylyltransferase MobA [Glaciimonas immobilis]KAF3998221.1 molybdenum cofactor guanylyltransferase MobA [Glaciimonas immobilis]
MQRNLITGLILAGGRGSRMGGVDKGLQRINNRSMVARVMATLAPQVGCLLINANRNLDAYAALGVPVWPDANDDFAGPLAGLLAGLQHCHTSYLATVPCDSPFLPTNLITTLSEALESANADIAIVATKVATGVGTHRRLEPDAKNNHGMQAQPVFMLLNTNLVDDLTTYLDEGGRKIETWYQRLNYVEVLFNDEMPFRNINTPDDLREAGNHQ